MTKKYLYWMMAAGAAAAMTLGLASCGDDGKDEEPGPGELKLTLTAGDVTDSSIKFTITPENAEKVYYTVIKDGETVPDAATILAEGTKGTLKEKTYTVSNLEPETAYTVAAAASSGDKVTEVKQVTMTTSAKVIVPIVELTAGAPNKTKLTFTLKATDAQKAAYVCVKKGETVPDAAGILSSGTAVEVSADGVQVTVEGLTAATEYVIAAAASYGETLSVVKQISMTTTETQVVDYYEALQGKWKASMKVTGVTAQGQIDPTKTVDVTFDVDITTGVNDWTTDIYSQNNALVCLGMLDFRYYSPEDLVGNDWEAEQANYDYGPKWFLMIDGTDITVPSGYANYLEGVEWVKLAGWTSSTTYLCPTNSSGNLYPGMPFEGVTVSEDLNTITIPAQEIEGKTFYPGVRGHDEVLDEWSFFKSFETGSTIGASAIVLTRQGGSVPAPASVGRHTGVPSINAVNTAPAKVSYCANAR